MDLAKVLLRTVVRAFYSTEYILVIDALVLHSTLPDKDLAFVLGMQTKHLRKLLGSLAEHGLVSRHIRGERKDGVAPRVFVGKDGVQQQRERLTNVEWYYINFHRAIDHVKYRLWKLQRHIEEQGAPTTEKKDLNCPQCKSSYTELEVLDHLDPSGYFLCHRCNHILDLADDTGRTAENESMKRLNDQLASIITLLQKIDATQVPENDFDAALRHALPVQRSLQDPGSRVEAVDLPQKQMLASSKGLTLAPEKFAVNVTDESGQADDGTELQLRREREARQNALPDWITRSTVTGTITTVGAREAAQQAERDKYLGGGVALDASEGPDKDKVVVVVDDKAAIDAYYAQMEREMRDEAERAAREDEDDDDDEDDDEFEDVDVSQTPLSAVAPAKGVAASSADTSGLVSSSATDDEREPKRVRIQVDGQAVAAGDTGRDTTVKDTAADSDEDEGEFEDV